MPPRSTNPSFLVPGALQPLLDVTKSIIATGIPVDTLDLVRLRVSQINTRTWSFPAEFGQSPDDDQRLARVADWRQQSDFTDAERAALELAEATTRFSDRNDPVQDEVWGEVARHYDQAQLGALIMHIGLVNLWNRVNVITRQDPAPWRKA